MVTYFSSLHKSTKKSTLIFFVLIVTLFLLALFISENREIANFQNIRPNNTINEVENLLGHPTTIEMATSGSLYDRNYGGPCSDPCYQRYVYTYWILPLSEYAVDLDSHGHVIRKDIYFSR